MKMTAHGGWASSTHRPPDQHHDLPGTTQVQLGQAAGSSVGSASRITRAGRTLEDSGVGDSSICSSPGPGTTSLQLLQPTLARCPDPSKHSSGRIVDRGGR
jgi:hypothetical protein